MYKTEHEEKARLFTKKAAQFIAGPTKDAHLAAAAAHTKAAEAVDAASKAESKANALCESDVTTPKFAEEFREAFGR
jgi:hypothetical protein